MSESTGQEVKLPCGQCIGCRIDRSRQWAVRCMHEASLHEVNSFITLTYSPEHLPRDQGLNKSHFQKFIKRLRKKYPEKKIRYYMCGEYGEAFGRPHYHALLFGLDFEDKVLWEIKRGSKIYRSETLEKLWPFGFSSIGAVTFQSAAYVARYVMKKFNGEKAKKHYQKADLHTGEVVDVQPEYNSMSLKPAIALDWYERYKKDVFPSDEVIINGKRVKTPRYYDKQLEAADPEQFETIKEKRREQAKKHLANNTPERLKVREQCQQNKLNQLLRELS